MSINSKTDFEKLKEIFDNQVQKTVKSNDWDDCKTYDAKRDLYYGKIEKRITLDKLGLIFIFNVRGRFVGIVNYKE